jgi:tetratricopeptide (TPR) repeat protein
MSRPRLIALLLGLATLIVYLPVTGHDFLYYDDDDYVTNNFAVQKGLTLDGIKWAFETFHAGNWHPLTWISHMTDCELFGLNAGAHHLVNALFHSANTALLFLVLWKMTGQVRPAVMVAALFAWHPLHVETVAWLAERKDVLSTCLALLALWQYADYAQKDRRRGYWLALVFFALSLLAKPMFVTFPFVLLLLDFWPLKRFGPDVGRWRLVWEKIPFLALAAASCVLTFLAQRTGDAVSSLGEWPMSNRIENAVASFGRYLVNTFWPVGLAADYPWAPVPRVTLVLSVAVLIFVSAVVWHWRSRRPYGVVGWLWFLGTLVPVIGLVQVGHAAMADRYTYFPSIGLFIALIFGLHEWCGAAPGRMKILTLSEFVILAACIGITEKQLTYWRNSETLFRRTLAVTKNNGSAHYALAFAYKQDGQFPEALAEYQETFRLSPRVPGLRVAIGEMLEKVGQPADALAEYRLDLRTEPQFPPLHNALGTVLAGQGDLAAATAELHQAVELNARYAQPHLELAKIYFASGQETDAANELLAAFHAEPDNFRVLTSVAHYIAANADETARDPQTALLLARKASDLSANRQPEVFDVMGMAFAAGGDFSNAVLCAQNALAFTPAARLKDAGPIRQRLELYQKHQPWLESFRATNAPPP